MGPKDWVLHGVAVAALLNGAGCATPKIGPTFAAKTTDPASSEQIIQATHSAPVPGSAVESARPRNPTVIPAVAAGPAVDNAHAGGAPTLLPPPQLVMSHAAGPEAAAPELTLAEALQLTANANPDLQSALERTRIAEAVLGNARAQFFPILASNTAYQATDNPLRKFTFLLSQGVADPQLLFPLPGSDDIFHTQIHFQHDLYTGGLRLARTRAAEADREASLCSLAAVRNRLVFQVAEAYYRVFQARALVGVRREAVAQVESQLKAVQSRFAANTVVRSDVL